MYFRAHRTSYANRCLRRLSSNFIWRLLYRLPSGTPPKQQLILAYVGAKLDFEISRIIQHGIADRHDLRRPDIAQSAFGILAIDDTSSSQDGFSGFLRVENTHKQLA